MDVKKLLAQLDRSESARTETSRRLTEATKTVKDLRQEAEKSQATKEKLTVSFFIKVPG